ncbi:uncharacterized protein LOC119571360 [Penaeus monodon]|uniref:uncharacterized protein LOC119571360 n=1 Tax=Penaeus monodon TaxID=6687 RepID=UPI0018A756E6|nr:uncharacterized protein LOC119571360 [Penaeus monodon]
MPGTQLLEIWLCRTIRGTMSFLADCIPLTPYKEEERFSIGVSIKEEINDNITEDTCVDIKEEPLDYADKERAEVSDMKVDHKYLFSHDLHDLRHEVKITDSCNLVQDRSDLLRTLFLAEDCGNKASSDVNQVMHKESLKEDTQPKMEATLNCFVCQVCGKKFSRKSHINIHMRVHTKEKPYRCDICYKDFSQRSNLVSHMRVHTKEKPYSCEICNKAFSKRDYIVTHMRVHTKEKPYSCGICNKAFSQKINLVNHMRVHKREKPYYCEICNKGFPKKNHLEVHMRIHLKEKPYNCYICNKAFSHKQNLVRHIRVHTKEKPESFVVHKSTHKREAINWDMARTPSFAVSGTQAIRCSGKYIELSKVQAFLRHLFASIRSSTLRLFTLQLSSNTSYVKSGLELNAAGNVLLANSPPLSHKNFTGAPKPVPNHVSIIFSTISSGSLLFVTHDFENLVDMSTISEFISWKWDDQTVDSSFICALFIDFLLNRRGVEQFTTWAVIFALSPMMFTGNFTFFIDLNTLLSPNLNVVSLSFPSILNFSSSEKLSNLVHASYAADISFFCTTCPCVEAKPPFLHPIVTCFRRKQALSPVRHRRCRSYFLLVSFVILNDLLRLTTNHALLVELLDRCEVVKYKIHTCTYHFHIFTFYHWKDYYCSLYLSIFHKKCSLLPGFLFSFHRGTMSFLADCIPLTPYKEEERFSIGVSIKEEINDNITEDTCVDIKEEPLDYADKERAEVSDMKVDHKYLFSHDLHDLRHEVKITDSCNLVQDRSDLLRTLFLAEDCGNKASSDVNQVMHKESLKEDTQPKMEATLNCFVCQVCGKKFSRKSHINIHMRVHTKEKPYRCDICYKDFSQRSNLVSHMRVHKKEKPYSCEICNKGFSKRDYIVTHMGVHTKEKPYNCDICNKAFSQKINLVNHMRVHKREKPYYCEICNKGFPKKNHLEVHMRIHLKEKPYNCYICNKAFSHKQNLVRHIRVHTKEKP